MRLYYRLILFVFFFSCDNSTHKGYIERLSINIDSINDTKLNNCDTINILVLKSAKSIKLSSLHKYLENIKINSLVIETPKQIIITNDNFFYHYELKYLTLASKNIIIYDKLTTPINEKVKHVNLYSDKFSSDVTNFIKCFQNIESIHIEGQFNILPNFICELPKLKSLEVYSDSLFKINNLSHFKSLELLDLQNTGFAKNVLQNKSNLDSLINSLEKNICVKCKVILKKRTFE